MNQQGSGGETGKKKTQGEQNTKRKNATRGVENITQNFPDRGKRGEYIHMGGGGGGEGGGEGGGGGRGGGGLRRGGGYVFAEGGLVNEGEKKV